MKITWIYQPFSTGFPSSQYELCPNVNAGGGVAENANMASFAAFTLAD